MRSAGTGDSSGLARALLSDHGEKQLLGYQSQACTFIWGVVWWRQVCYGNDTQSPALPWVGQASLCGEGPGVSNSNLPVPCPQRT